MLDLSIIIPSLRIDNIKSLAQFFEKNITVDYELIVISPYDIDIVNSVFIKEDKIEGIYKAVRKGMDKAKGKYVLHMPDDACPSVGSVERMIDFSCNFIDRLFLGNWMVYNFKTVYEQGSYYDLPFSGFPFMRRKDIDKVGELMDTYYDSFYGDPDLSLRVWNSGGVVALCNNSWMSINSTMDGVKSNSLDKYEKSDKEKFIKRWSEKYGEFTDYKPYKHQVTGIPPG